MPYPSILKDLNAKAIPQVYDGNNFQPDTGKRILYGPDGITPLSVVDNKLGVRLYGRNASIGEADESSSTTINAGGGEITDVYAPSGKLRRVKAVSLSVNIPPGATTGTQTMYITLGTLFSSSIISGTDIGSLRFDGVYWRVADTQQPTTEQAQAIAVNYLVFDADTPLRIAYNNDTNANQDTARTMKYSYEEEGVI